MAQPSSESRVSTFSQVMIVALGFLIIGLIYAFIFVFSGWNRELQLWAAGLTGWIFALVFYLTHASLREEKVAWALSGIFFALGTVALYSSVLVSSGDESGKILWLIVISIIVMLILLLAGSMAKSKARHLEREARRKVL